MLSSRFQSMPLVASKLSSSGMLSAARRSLVRMTVSAVLMAVLFGVGGVFSEIANAEAYRKATEGKEVVLHKLFPKKKRLELDARFGYILNQSYLDTIVMNGSLSYFFSEEWGVSAEATLALNQDKSERACLETFFNDNNEVIGQECDPNRDPSIWEEGRAAETAAGKTAEANWGPAYVPIRELKYIVGANLLWNPIYGKQIILLSATNYFDFYVSMGGGLAFSDYYPKAPVLRDGTTARGKASPGNPVGTTDPTLIGEEGRPDPESQTNPLLQVAIGQRFHFMKRFLINAELKHYTLIGGESGFESFFTLIGGVGVRL